MWARITAGALAIVVAITLAIMWPGYDARQTPPINASVWALQTGDGKRFARVNTVLGELDTVKDVLNPTQIFQNDDVALVFTDGNQRFAQLNPAMPGNLDDSAADQFYNTPADTIHTVQEGGWIAYLTGKGDVYAGELSSEPVLIDPFFAVQTPEGAEKPHYASKAIALNNSGLLALYSSAEARVHVFDLEQSKFVSEEEIVTSIGANIQLSYAADKWVLFDEDSNFLWSQQSKEPIAVNAETNQQLQSSSPVKDKVYVADNQGIIEVSLNELSSERIVESRSVGTPAKPFTLAGVTYGAWLSETAGSIWSSNEANLQPLDFNGQELETEQTPVFLGNGTSAILNEQRSGWVWSLPTAELVLSSQHWRFDEKTPDSVKDVQAQKVFDPKPPVAEPDSFGVRAGRATMLPVLLNDHDPNEDVLTIDADSITELDPAFGELSVTNEGQEVVVSVQPDASGTASFQYRVTDGTSSDGLFSNTTTVTLTVQDDDINTAPEWCGVTGCLAEWPKIDVQPGGTGQAEVLGGWVDPEGDAIYVSGAVFEAESGQLIVTPEGLLTYQHSNPQQTEAETFNVEIEVSDVRGQKATKPLTVSVQPTPQLNFESFAATGTVRQRIEIDASKFVTGVSGTARVVTANLVEEQPATIRVQPKSLSFGFEAAEAGIYLLQLTIADDDTEVSGTVKVTVVEADKVSISTTPLTAFVRPNEDATIDVLPAITDPTGAILMLDKLELDIEDNADLSAQLIGQQHIRVAGTTADGNPGVLGVARYTVADGSGLPHRKAQGEITIVLLAQSDASAPIAVDDEVFVRQGAQIDIQVLDNDVAPTGSQIQIDPGSIVNEHDAGLAFATNSVIRYLAPEEPGDYSLSYSVFRLGHPSKTDTARVRITVLGEAENAAPEPPTLEGRVLSGKRISIPFQAFGFDSDGDEAILERITNQPEYGHASINAEGDAIEYSSELGHSGQIIFGYEVRDEGGLTGEGEVRIGVLEATSDPKPVTYSDYLQVQQGADNSVLAFPLDNDIDPLDSVLTLTDVRPNAVPGTSEYEGLEKRMLNVDLDGGSVLLAAGEDLGTASYVYTAENSKGDTSKGLIIVKVVREPVPDYPLVRDTRLTTENVEQLIDGIDVLTNRVSWSSGDAAALQLELWREEIGFTTKGWNIIGSQTDRTQVIPFAVSGTSFRGDEITSYGFLRVPGKSDIKLTLRQAFSEVSVKEKESIDIDLGEAVRVPSGEQLEVLASDVTTGKNRQNATCSLISTTTLRYHAGEGAPWQDTCTVGVKLKSQSNYTYLSIRINIIAEDPRPELRNASLTVSPGDSQTYDLNQMVTWEGKTDFSGLTFAANYGGSQFEVTQSGSILTIHALDTAKPTREEPVVVSLASHQDTVAANLSLVVGPAPSVLPKGATVTGVCTQSSGTTSCSIPVIGAPGEVNPLPNTALQLVSAEGSQNCEAVSFSVENSTSIRASWRSDAPGAADCTGTFAVQDAQGRVSSGDRVGTVILDLRGLPADPTRLDWVGYTAKSVNLSAVSERSSYPAVTEYRVTGPGISVTCPASGECNIPNLENGKQIAFQVNAINEVGSSRSSVGITAWAYQVPDAPASASAKPLPTSDGKGHLAQIEVGGIDPTTSALRVSKIGGAEAITVPVTGATASFEYNVGFNQPTDLEIIPTTKFEVPPASVGGGSSTGRKIEVLGAHGIGKPGLNLKLTKKLFPSRIIASGELTANGGSELKIGFAKGNEVCVPNETASAGSFERQFNSGYGQQTKITVCAEHTDGGQSFGVTSVNGNETVNIPSPTGSTYTVDATLHEISASTYSWGPVTHDLSVEEGFLLFFQNGATKTQNINEIFVQGANPGTVQALACDIDNINSCSSPVTLSDTGAPYIPIVSFDPFTDDAGICLAEDLSSFIHMQDPDGILRITSLTTDNIMHTFVQDLFGALNALELTCELPPPPDPPDPQEPDPLDPDAPHGEEEP